MSKFNVGDSVYCIINGIGIVKSVIDNYYKLNVLFNSSMVTYNGDGRISQEDVNPILLTLQEAREKGYNVPKQKVTKTITRYVNRYKDYLGKEIYETSHLASLGAGLSVEGVVMLTGTYEVEE